MDATTSGAWSTSLRERARRRDRRRGIDTTPRADDPLVEGWAIARLAALGATSPVWGPPLVVGSAVNHSRATRRSAGFASQLDRIEHHRPPLAPANRTAHLDGRRRIVVVSDLHRAIPGPCDWPHRQGAVPVIDTMYEHYASEGWTLCENGDIEEFWMVGGTAEGVTYDVTRLAGATADALGHRSLLDRVYRDHLTSIIDNNTSTYRLVREGFAAEDRYVRLVGNHDDPLSRPAVAEVLSDRLGGVQVWDYAVVERDGAADALITHGHHTDGWNGPNRDLLGKTATWIGSLVRDVPFGVEPGAPPDGKATRRLLTGGAPNRLIPVHRIFGASTDFDTMDEELLFAAVGDRDEGPWVILGHTHSPVLSPTSRVGGAWSRYANSGCGVWNGMVTALEYDGTGPESTITLVAWAPEEGGDPDAAVRHELIPEGDRLTCAGSAASGVSETAGTAV